MQFQRIGFLGCGNMGSALARAAAPKAGDLLLADHAQEKARALAAELGGAAADNGQVARQCDLIFLGVKPQMMAGLLSELGPVLRERSDRFVLVTMAAGLSIAAIRQMAGADWPVIRIMPNTCAAIGQGMLALTDGGAGLEQELAGAQAILARAGRVERLDEGLMDAFTAVAGCGPAYVYPFIEALADGGVMAGLPRAKAQIFAAQTLLGAAAMVLESGEHPGALKDAVCSPGGSTIAGVAELERRGFRAAAIQAVLAAYEKNMELGKQK